MGRKIAADAFSVYCAMGPGRSYQALAERYGVTKRAVTRLASKENWSSRLAKIEQEAREKADRRAVETLDDMNERHLRIAKTLQAKALKALMAQALDEPRDVIRALDLGVRQERLVRGEPTDRQAATIEEITRSEIATLLTVEREEPERGAPPREQG